MLVRNPQSAIQIRNLIMDGAPTAPETMEEADQQLTRVPLVLHRRNFSWLTERISGVAEQPAPRWWWVAFAITSSIATFGLFCIGYLIFTGIGTWGNQIPVGWAWDITNFVFWIGIGHAGTLISAILFLLRQKWRSLLDQPFRGSDDAVCGDLRGDFPRHSRRSILDGIVLAPIPNNWAIWQNFRSPLMWDVFAVSTYFSCLGPVLVHRFDSGFGNLAQPRPQRLESFYLEFSRAAGAAQTATGAITRWRIYFWRAFPRRWFFQCTASYRSTSRRQSFQRGIRQSFRLTSLPAQSSAGSRWC